jgi:hypothetical protein
MRLERRLKGRVRVDLTHTRVDVFIKKWRTKSLLKLNSTNLVELAKSLEGEECPRTAAQDVIRGVGILPASIGGRQSKGVFHVKI